MGYFSSDHIQQFVKGQVIKEVVANGPYDIVLEFASGEKLVMYPFAKISTDRQNDGAVSTKIIPEIITTPMNANGTIKQSTEIADKKDVWLKVDKYEVLNMWKCENSECTEGDFAELSPTALGWPSCSHCGEDMTYTHSEVKVA